MLSMPSTLEKLRMTMLMVHGYHLDSSCRPGLQQGPADHLRKALAYLEETQQLSL
jgi:hypothetical protein